MAKDSKSLMIQGTSSHVGKSIAVAAICRILKQDGYSVCPFKSQNMALNSYITASGGEMGRAQVVQAEACGLEPEVFMNPVLIKPVADTRAQIIFMGKVLKNMSASEYDGKKKMFLDKIKELLDDIKSKFDYVIIEGAGSPAEINLLENDIVNMRTAVVAGSPVILVGDVDKGGVFASFYGTVKLLPAHFQKYIRGLLVNKFRGDVNLLQPGNDYIAKKLGIPVLGTIPYFRDIHIEEEDSVNLERERDRAAFLSRTKGSEVGRRVVVAVIYLPHISNFTDFDALGHEDEVSLIYIRSAADLAALDPHMIIIPGSKSTIGDLIYLRESGIEEEIKKQYGRQTSVIGICGGYQMLGKIITDRFKSESKSTESIEGMGLLDIATDYLKKKNTYQVEFDLKGAVRDQLGTYCNALRDLSGGSSQYGKMKGYEIHMGISKIIGSGNDLIPLFDINRRGDKEAALDDGLLKFDRENKKMIMGTYIHGIFDNYIFRRAVVAVLKGFHNIRSDSAGSSIKSYNDFKQSQYNRLADLFRENMDMDLFYKILKSGV
ncbi:MAG TPA: cobyric acid synthase CobQ [Actinobacteria bacterium]|nr:cobyric acid synthase CobQ [Actinomycetota bacterium]